MKLTLPGDALSRAAWLAAATRCFCGLALGGAHAGAWLAALAGAALAEWLVRGVDRVLLDGHDDLPPVPAAALLLPLLTDLLFSAHILTGSAEYLAPEPTSALLPKLLLALALGWIVSRNGAGMVYGAAMWLRLLPLLFLPVLLLQLTHFRAAWLFPLLGSGAALLPDALRSALWLALPFVASRLLADGKPPQDRRFSPLTAGLTVAALLLLRQMMTPAMPGVLDASWLNRLDSLLTNGRAPLYLQLPMIALWTVCLVNLASFDALACASCLQRLAPGLDGRLCGAATAGFALIGLLTTEASSFAAGRWDWAACLPLAACIAMNRFGRRPRPC